MRPLRIMLLGASFETCNMGVSALTMGAIHCILERWPDAKVSILDYGTTERTYTIPFRGRSVSVPLQNLRFSKKPYQRNHIAQLIGLSLLLRLIPFAGLRDRIVRSNPWLVEIEGTDIFCSVAGGDSFSDIYGMMRLFYIALPLILVLLLRKRLLLLPQTMGPFKSKTGQAMARYIVARAELVYCRDGKGVGTITQLMGETFASEKLRFCYDMGFILEPIAPANSGVIGIPAASTNNHACVVGLNVSGLLFMGGYTRKNMFGLACEYDKLMYRLIDYLIIEKHASVLLVPHVFGNEAESDTGVCAMLYEQLKVKYGERLGFAVGQYNQSEIKYLIGKCDFFIGSRMHACIAAISQNVPTLCIAYSDKFVGVMETVGVADFVADPRTMPQEQIVALLARAYDQRPAIRQSLQTAIPRVKQTVLNILEEALHATSRKQQA